VQEWLDKNQHITFHFTPVGSSWLNQVETQTSGTWVKIAVEVGQVLRLF
jgi:hypothetical protein